MTASHWYYVDREDRQQGPVVAAAVVEAFRGAQLTADSLVWREGLPAWVPLRQMGAELGLDFSVGAAPPPMPPPSPAANAGVAAVPGGSANDIVYAGFLRRWAALFLDSFILGAGLILLMLALMIPLGLAGRLADDTPDFAFQALYWLIWIIAAPLYYAGQESSVHQATLGKRALGIKVTDNDGARLSFGHALGRWLAASLSYLTLYIGFLMAAFSERKRALHDMLAGTLVVDRWAFTASPERQQRGLSGCLIGFLLVVVLGIPMIAILVAVAVSQYQDYVIRTQVSEGMALAEGVKVAVAEYAAQNDALPVDNAAAGLSPAEDIRGRYVRAVTVADGVVHVVYTSQGVGHANAALDGRELVLTPTRSGESLAWSCESPNIRQKWCPRSCQCQ